MSTVILAGTTREADAYRVENGPRFANYNPTTAQVLQAHTIVELPSFADRRDRFALAQARDNRLKYGPSGIDHVVVEDWVWPKPKPDPVEEPSEADYGVNQLLVAQLDLTDEAVLEELKVALNAVGLTLKKLPVKKGDDSVAPKKQDATVETPVEF